MKRVQFQQNKHGLLQNRDAFFPPPIGGLCSVLNFQEYKQRMLLLGTRLLRILEKLNMALIEFFRVLQSHVHSALFNVCFISDITDVNHYCISLRNAFNLQSSGPKFVFERGRSAIQSQMCSYLVVPTGFLYTCYRATTGRTNTSVGTILRT